MQGRAVRVAVAVTLAAVLAVPGCGPEALAPLRVVNESAQPWAQEPSVNDRALEIAEESARWWGGRADDLRGWTLVIQDGIVSCGDWNETMGVWGCHDPSIRTLRVSTAFGDCIEAAAIPHEVGHLVIGDGAHTDPRWSALAFGPGMCGYPALPP